MALASAAAQQLEDTLSSKFKPNKNLVRNIPTAAKQLPFGPFYLFLKKDRLNFRKLEEN